MPEERTAVAALFVEQDTIYYTCKQRNSKKNPPYEFMLRKCRLNGMLDFCIPGFNHVRGIAKDSEGNYYVVETSPEHRIIKFDKNFEPLKRSNKEAHDFLLNPHGIFVDKGKQEDEDKIFVCSEQKCTVCILNTDLKICYKFELKYSPRFITKFDNEFAVTTFKDGIIIINIDLIKLKYKGRRHKSILLSGGSTERFGQCELWGICSGQDVIYVAEHGQSGRLLCLKYNKNRLYYADSEKNRKGICSGCSPKCSPLALAYHDGKVFYSQGNYEKKFHIVQMSHGKLFDA